ncbi:MAG: hypothetical protein NVS3B7_01480 [Candidatus Elarobacter sp.]
MDARLDGTRPRRGRSTQTLTPRFSGFEVLMFGLLGIALVDCVCLAWLIVRGVN